MTFQNWLNFTVTKLEGGYVLDHRSGPTNFGIIKRYLDIYLRLTGHAPISLAAFHALKETDVIVSDYYESQYWEPMKCDELHGDSVAIVLADGAVQHGCVTMTELLQKCVGVSIDGNFGPLTLRAVENKITSLGSNGVATILLVERWTSIYKVINDPIDMVGWKNRLIHLASFIGINNLVLN